MKSYRTSGGGWCRGLSSPTGMLTARSRACLGTAVRGDKGTGRSGGIFNAAFGVALNICVVYWMREEE